MSEPKSRAKLTVLVPCKDEQNNIGACIDSFATIADETLIADSGSTDKTLEIVQQANGCRLIEREYRTSGDFKNWAIPQASHEWVLLVDADERITPSLAKEIQQTLEAPTKDGYWIYRENHFMGHPVRFGSWRSDKVMRLFRRDVGRYEGPSDHGEIQIPSGKTGKLKSRMTHYTYWSYDQLLRKYQRYTTLQAQQWFDAGKRPSLFKLFLNPPLRFFRDYFLKLGLLDGAIGFQLAMLAAFYTFAKQARLWTMHFGLPQPIDSSAAGDSCGQSELKNSRLQQGSMAPSTDHGTQPKKVA